MATTRDLEEDKAILDEILEFLPRNKPDVDKIKNTPVPRLKELTKNSLAVMTNSPSLKKLADARKQKKLCHAIKAILDNSSATDPDFIQFSEIFTRLLALRNLEKPDKTDKPGKPNKINKRKKGEEQDPELMTAFNYYSKVQKTIVSPSDKSIPETWIKIPSSLKEPIVFIDTQDEKAAVELSKAIEANKIQLKISAEITNLRFRGEKVIVKLTTAVQADKFKEEMKSLFEGVDVYSPEQRDPMIQLFRIPKETKVDELINELRKFNHFNMDDKIIFHKSFENNFGGTKNVILRVSPAIRQELENRRGTLLYRCTTIKAVDYFGILKCTRCLQYSHLKSSCASQSICKHCADHHQSTDCPNQLNSSKFKCASCGKAGHRSFDLRACEEYLRQLTHAASITNYAYTYVIQD